jgi:hypothetical protein
MAENADINNNSGVAGTSFTAAADDIAGVKYQLIKIVDATADSVVGLIVNANGKALVRASELETLLSTIDGHVDGIEGLLAGTLTVGSHPVTNAGTFAVQAAGALPGGGTTGWSVASGSIGATKTDIGTANTAGQVGGWYFYNANSSVAYVQFFNAQASAVTLGTTTPIYSLGIPATSGANIPAGLLGINHSTAICIAITTTRAGSTGPSSTVDYNIFYKQ